MNTLSILFKTTSTIALVLAGVSSTHLDAQATAHKKEELITARIVGGSDVIGEEHPFPFMAALVKPGMDADEGFSCGASLIHPYWVITAAHCVIYEPADQIEVLIGARDLTAIEATERIAVAEIIIHPNYDYALENNDVALLRLARPANAPYVRLNSDIDLESPGNPATIVGWGRLSENDPELPHVLQKATTELVAMNDAQDAYAEINRLITENMLAAGNLIDGGIDTCAGDSGGPLLLEDVDGAWTLGGITSFGFGCGQPNFPGIYTRVSQIRSWAMQYILPKYAAWELQNNVYGEVRDFDNDGSSNFLEFAMGTDPGTGNGNGLHLGYTEDEQLVFRFNRPLDTSLEVEYKIWHSSTLAPDSWQELNLAAHQLEVETIASHEQLTFTYPPGQREFIRVAAQWPKSVAHQTRPLILSFTYRSYSELTDNLRISEDNHYYQEFQFIDAIAEEPVRITLRSTEFQPSLELYNAATGIQLAPSNPIDVEDNRVQLILEPEQLSSTLLRVTSANPLETGRFDLLATIIRNFVVLELNTTTPGELTTDNPLAEDALPEEYFKQDYDLDALTGFEQPIDIIVSSNEFNPFMGLYIKDSDQIVAVASSESDTARLTVQPELFGYVYLRISTNNQQATGAYQIITEPSVNVSPININSNQIVAGELTTTSLFDPISLPETFYYIQDYRLTNLAGANRPVEVTLTSNDFDAFLMILDADTGEILAENDDISSENDNFNSRVTLQPVNLRSNLLIRVSTSFELETGSYFLQTNEL